MKRLQGNYHSIGSVERAGLVGAVHELVVLSAGSKKRGIPLDVDSSSDGEETRGEKALLDLLLKRGEHVEEVGAEEKIAVHQPSVEKRGIPHPIQSQTVLCMMESASRI